MAFYCFCCDTFFDSIVEHLPKSRFNPNLPQCPHAHCLNELVEIDDGIAAIVVALNKKGYITKNSCSGHIYESSPYLSIGMCDDLPIAREIEKRVPNLPEGFMYETSPECNKVFITKRWDIKRDRNYEENLELKMDMQKSSIELGMWVKKLPDISKELEKTLY